MASRVLLPGESTENCRKRTFQQAVQEWNRMSAAERAPYTGRAQAHNRTAAATARLAQAQQVATPACSSDPEQQQQRQQHQQVAEAGSPDAVVLTTPSTNARGVDFVAPYQGIGAMGAGDRSFALSRSLVRRLQQDEAATQGTGKQFVTRLDGAWRARSRGRVGEADEFKQSTAMSCHEEFKCTLCSSKIKNGMLQDMLSEQLLTFVSEYRQRFVVSKRNTGPNCSVQHPLLVIKHKTWLVPRFLLIFNFSHESLSRATGLKLQSAVSGHGS
ncbi:unnamed protein product [Symbiodinium sp. CCMP2592]|nr:unnamed protein product [Symbiodinium sp. CCMP2592]